MSGPIKVVSWRGDQRRPGWKRGGKRGDVHAGAWFPSVEFKGGSQRASEGLNPSGHQPAGEQRSLLAGHQSRGTPQACSSRFLQHMNTTESRN